MPLTASELRALRRRLGLTQTALAALIPVSRGTVARWEIGATIPEPMARLVRRIAAERGKKKRTRK